MHVFALKRKERFPDERLIHIYNCRRVHSQRAVYLLKRVDCTLKCLEQCILQESLLSRVISLWHIGTSASLDTQHRTTVSACLLHACARHTTQINALQSYSLFCSGSACGCLIDFHSVLVDVSLLVIKLIRAFGNTLGV